MADTVTSAGLGAACDHRTRCPLTAGKPQAPSSRSDPLLRDACRTQARPWCGSRRGWAGRADALPKSARRDDRLCSRPSGRAHVCPRAPLASRGCRRLRPERVERPSRVLDSDLELFARSGSTRATTPRTRLQLRRVSTRPLRGERPVVRRGLWGIARLSAGSRHEHLFQPRGSSPRACSRYFACSPGSTPSGCSLQGSSSLSSWPVLLYVPTASQESLQQALAMVLAGVFCRAVSSRGRRCRVAERSLGVTLLLVLRRVLRFSWAVLLVPVLLLLLCDP